MPRCLFVADFFRHDKNSAQDATRGDIFATAEVVFDPAKDVANIAKHRLSLAQAPAFEMSEAVVEIDDRYDYREQRFRAFGRVAGEARCLVFTYREGEVRVISFRRGHEKEMRRHGL